MNIGFLGLGTMGAPMARNLLKAGFALRVWNRSRGPVDALTSAGATPGATPAAAARGADILIAMLADDDTSRAVLCEGDDGGALGALPRGAIVVNMATVSLAFAREMVARCESLGLRYLAAPVLGRVTVAEAGKLNILVAGDTSVIDTVQPIFDVLGQRTWRFGDSPERANVVKLAANFMIASAIESMSEAAALAQGHGVAGADFLDMMTTTIFATPVYTGYGAAIAKEVFEPAGFKLALGAKDVRLALLAGEAANVPMPFGTVLRDNHLDSLAHDEGQLDWAALSRVALRRAGLPRTQS
ncbi:3-hydroxyisobutyrate dehydrogenase [Pandoraea horticolens]|uniref:3-hydroxyisobutyrate dehydrogenase n=1 Tax=Pandoraea horticolens TaxID=2508298 RepID=A0A5E4RLT4_9BURK|nr:NAD(P)-dependent oxidoreductase [Pandoraea horticolens]VVD62999.1 3-hydroxyisobutyrate dehydrogenase [Pandoraea horticolens]